MAIEIKRFACAAAVCSASLLVCAYSALPIEETFEGGSLDSAWTGGTAKEYNASAYTAGVGTPITNVNHTKVFWVEGAASFAYADTDSQNRTLDFLMMAEDIPDDELPDADGDEQFRFAFDTNGCVNLYHRYNGANRWTVLSDTQYPSGTWVRVTLKVEYPASAEGYAACQVIVDGSPCSTDKGYRAADLSDAGGSWYMAATNGVKLSKVDFVGIGGVDDFVFASTADYVVPGSNSTTNGVDYGWLIENGISADKLDEKADSSSAYTAKQSFDAGVDPYSSTPLYVTNATFSGGNLSLVINGCKGVEGATYTVKSSTSPMSASNHGTDAGATCVGNPSAKTTTATVTIPTENAVTYFQVESTVGGITTTNQFGLLKVLSTNANTIISAPWVSLDANVENPTPMNVAKLVNTNNLTVGDTLILFNDDAEVEKYIGWTLGNDGWIPLTVQTEYSGITVSPPASATTLTRGLGVWLVRQNPTDGGNAVPFYLYGQYTAAAASTSVTAGKTMLLANPNPNNSFSLDGISPGSESGDKIIIPGSGVPKVYTHDGTSWGYEKTTYSTVGEGGDAISVQDKTRVTNENNVNAGQGFWYKSDKGSPTINW